MAELLTDYSVPVDINNNNSNLRPHNITICVYKWFIKESGWNRNQSRTPWFNLCNSPNQRWPNKIEPLNLHSMLLQRHTYIYRWCGNDKGYHRYWLLIRWWFSWAIINRLPLKSQSLSTHSLLDRLWLCRRLLCLRTPQIHKCGLYLPVHRQRVRESSGRSSKLSNKFVLLTAQQQQNKDERVIPI